MTQRWAINPKSLLHWRSFGDDWVVFDVASGQTHLLDVLSAAVLMSIQDGATELDTIPPLMQALGIEEVPESLAGLRTAVSQLVTLGLVQPQRA